jgi:hypothetical protein
MTGNRARTRAPLLNPATPRRVRRQRFVVLLLFALGTLSGSSIAQLTITFPSSDTAPQHKEAQSKEILSVSDVIKLSKGGLSDDVIIAQIKKRPQPFDLTPDQLLQLKAAQVSDRVIEAMTGTSPTAVQVGGNLASRPSEKEQSPDSPPQTTSDNVPVQQWASVKKSDPLTGKSYMLYVLTGRYLSAPANGSTTAPLISLRCDPSPHHKLSGELIAGFVDVGTVVDIENGQNNTVRYRLDDGKVQTATGFEVGYSTDYTAISIKDIFLNNLLWGHMITHKPRTSSQVHKVVISVQEHLDGDVVMQFDMPDAGEVGAACGTEYRK